MAGIFVPFLADAARLTGYPVVELPGWRTAGHDGMRAVEGVGGHHTANPNSGDFPSLRIVRDGRADLRGPLSNLGLGRSGTQYVIAAGQCWHAGASRWAGFHDLNDEFLGIEAESRGTVDDWTPEQRDCYPRLVAALLFFMRRGADRFCGHREMCLPPGRKIDPAFWDLPAMRTRVDWLLGDPLRRIPRFTSPPPAFFQEDEDDMQNFPISGRGRMVLVCPTGDAAANKRLAWLSAAVLDGTGSVRVFAQGAKAGIHDWWWSEGELANTPDNHVKRLVKPLQNGVTHLVVSWDLTKATGGVLCLETKPQA